MRNIMRLKGFVADAEVLGTVREVEYRGGELVIKELDIGEAQDVIHALATGQVQRVGAAPIDTSSQAQEPAQERAEPPPHTESPPAAKMPEKAKRRAKKAKPEPPPLDPPVTAAVEKGPADTSKKLETPEAAVEELGAVEQPKSDEDGMADRLTAADLPPSFSEPPEKVPNRMKALSEETARAIDREIVPPPEPEVAPTRAEATGLTEEQEERAAIKEHHGGIPKEVAEQEARQEARKPSCVACAGSGKNSRGGTCRPCKGTGLKQAAKVKPSFDPSTGQVSTPAKAAAATPDPKAAPPPPEKAEEAGPLSNSSNGVPEKLRSVGRLAHVLRFLVEEEGLTGNKELVARCEELKATGQISPLNRVPNMSERVPRTLSVMRKKGQI
jgi:hypothetical protein